MMYALATITAAALAAVSKLGRRFNPSTARNNRRTARALAGYVRRQAPGARRSRMMPGAHRVVDFSIVKNPDALARAIVDLLRRRKNPMRAREIVRWFCATPERTVKDTLDTLVMGGQVDGRRTSLNRNRHVLEYSASDVQEGPE